MPTRSNVLDFLNVNEVESPLDLVSSPLTPLQLHKLIDCTEAYGQTLRIWMLRVLLYTPAIEHFKREYSFALEQSCSFLGLENYEFLTFSKDLVTLRQEFEGIQQQWALQLDEAFVFPAFLQTNLNKLSEVVTLSETEKLILGFFILLHAEDVLSDCCDLIGNNLNEFSLAKNLAPVLGIELRELTELLGPQSSLRRSGLIQFDIHSLGTMRYCIDLVTPMFVGLMLKDQQSMHDLLQGTVQRAEQGHLLPTDYPHVEDRLEAVKTYLRHAMAHKQSGVNIMIYGANGTGKTQLAKLIAQELGCCLMEISASNEQGDPVSATRRLRSYRLAQPFFNHGDTIILFDECEEVFSSNPFLVEDTDKKSAGAMKSWINQSLDHNNLPTIWIANSIDNLDLAYIRRFAMCFEMTVPPESQRYQLLTHACNGVISEEAITHIAKSPAVSPALITKSAEVIKVIAADKSESERDRLILQLINDKLRVQGAKEVTLKEDVCDDAQSFAPELIHCETDLVEILEGVRHSGQGRLIFFGPPGTGKTEAGKWLAKNLEMPHLAYKVSDLLSPYVGESEQNIARAFKRARLKNAVLQLDEVDSFLSERGQSRQNWTTTIVNQILTEIDTFEGVFVASTNRIEQIDEAALRRFDLCLKFDFMKPAQAVQMFTATCAELGITSEVDVWSASLSKLKNLTPGDFAQIKRQAKFLKHHSAQKVFESLQKAISLKKSTVYHSMGFVQAT